MVVPKPQTKLNKLPAKKPGKTTKVASKAASPSPSQVPRSSATSATATPDPVENEPLADKKLVDKCPDFGLLIQRHFPDIPKDSEEACLTALSSLVRCRLDAAGLTRIDGLELLGSRLTHLFLQHNSIGRIENLEWLSNLQYLTLAHNQIEEVSPDLLQLNKLILLDLSHNNIVKFEPRNVPQSTAFLDLRHNPACEAAKGSLTERLARAALPRLRQFNGILFEDNEDSEDEIEDDANEPAEDQTEDFKIDGDDSVWTYSGLRPTFHDIVERSEERLDQYQVEAELNLKMAELSDRTFAALKSPLHKDT